MGKSAGQFGFYDVIMIRDVTKKQYVSMESVHVFHIVRPLTLPLAPLWNIHVFIIHKWIVPTIFPPLLYYYIDMCI